jgi:hypothetical protein
MEAKAYRAEHDSRAVRPYLREQIGRSKNKKKAAYAWHSGVQVGIPI